MMRWISSGQSCISPSMAFPSWYVRMLLGRRPSPASSKVSGRTVRRNGLVLRYGRACRFWLQGVIPHKCRNRAQDRSGEGAPGHRRCWLLSAAAMAAAEDRPAAAPAPAGLAGAADVPRGRRPRFQFRRGHQPAVRLPQRLEIIAVIEPMPRLIGPGACGGGDMVQAQRRAARRSRPHRDQAGAGAALRDGGVARRLDRGRSGAATQERRHGFAQRRQLRRFRMPRPQPGAPAPSSASTARATPSMCAPSRSPTAA